jgi:hypothetical protein
MSRNEIEEVVSVLLCRYNNVCKCCIEEKKSKTGENSKYSYTAPYR